MILIAPYRMDAVWMSRAATTIVGQANSHVWRSETFKSSHSSSRRRTDRQHVPYHNTTDFHRAYKNRLLLKLCTQNNDVLLRSTTIHVFASFCCRMNKNDLVSSRCEYVCTFMLWWNLSGVFPGVLRRNSHHSTQPYSRTCAVTFVILDNSVSKIRQQGRYSQHYCLTPITVYSRYIAVGGVQAMVPRYKWERDISGVCHEPKSGSIFQHVVSDNGAYVCLAASSARRQRI